MVGRKQKETMMKKYTENEVKLFMAKGIRDALEAVKKELNGKPQDVFPLNIDALFDKYKKK